MIRYRSIFICIAVAFLCITAAFAAGDAARGKEVYQKTCQKCHGADHKGNPAIAKTLKVEFRDLTSKDVLAKKDDELKRLSLGPTEKKKPVKGVTPEQLDDVISYIRAPKK